VTFDLLLENTLLTGPDEHTHCIYDAYSGKHTLIVNLSCFEVFYRKRARCVCQDLVSRGVCVCVCSLFRDVKT